MTADHERRLKKLEAQRDTLPEVICVAFPLGDGKYSLGLEKDARIVTGEYLEECSRRGGIVIYWQRTQDND